MTLLTVTLKSGDAKGVAILEPSFFEKRYSLTPATLKIENLTGQSIIKAGKT